jgi:hypothetical protein
MMMQFRPNRTQRACSAGQIGLAALALCMFLSANTYAQQPDSVENAAKTPVITSFDAPGAGTSSGQGTAGYSINTSGAITGSYTDSSNVSHAFVRTP